MQDHDTRTAILRLHVEGHGKRAIAEALGVSRGTVKRVLKAGTAAGKAIVRREKAEPHAERIQTLYLTCKGNLVRVHEELAAVGIHLSYPTLTRFCRRRGIGQTPKERVGQYTFEPGEEMQHDTSPHDVVIGGHKRRLHCASLVLCYSRMLFAMVFPRWNRFWAKVFLTEALRFFGGAAGRCMLDNASILVAGGTGKNAVIAPEMVAFANRFFFVFIAHALGDVNRSARVERPFDYIENNFYAGRTFNDVADTNAQLRAWCERANGLPKRTIQARPIELFTTERLHLKPLPIYIPDVYRVWTRTVDEEGYVHLHTNRYSMPESSIDREVSVHETPDRIRIFDRKALICEHDRQEEGAGKRRTLPEHERQARWHHRGRERPARPEETCLVASSPALAAMVEALKKRHGGRATRPLLRLHRMWLEYPKEPLDTALKVALDHGLFDLDRIETLVLRHVAGDFFRLPTHDDQDGDDTKEP
jgi:transposase